MAAAAAVTFEMSVHRIDDTLCIERVAPGSPERTVSFTPGCTARRSRQMAARMASSPVFPKP